MKHIITALTACCSLLSFGQIDKSEFRRAEPLEMSRFEFHRADVPPAFDGTDKEMMDFIEKRFQLTPEMLEGMNHELQIDLQIDVAPDGKVVEVYDWSNRRIIFQDMRDLPKKSTALRDELRRIFLLMPNWIPGKTNGKNVLASVRYEFAKPIAYLYGNEAFSDELVYTPDGKPDTAHIYYNPQIKPQQHLDSNAYHYTMSKSFNYPEALIKDSVAITHTYECVINEKGEVISYKLGHAATPYPLLDSLLYEHMSNLPDFEPGSIDGIAVKCTTRIGIFAYPPFYYEKDMHGLRPEKHKGLFYQSRMQGLRRYFENHFTYPDELLEAPVFGTVYLSLEANEDGSLKSCYVASGIHPLIDKAVEDVICSSDKWTYRRGQAILLAVRISERHL